MIRSRLTLNIFTVLWILTGVDAMATDTVLIDDRSTGSLHASNTGEWRLVTDRVMGGISTGNIALYSYRGRECIRMQGSVSTENNGGFVQIALDLADGKHFDASDYTGVMLQVAGNGESYNVHLRTTKLWLPWQSYRASFEATPAWSELRIPFTDFKAYRTNRGLDAGRLSRIGLVAIGRDFDADLCLARLQFYRDD